MKGSTEMIMMLREEVVLDLAVPRPRSQVASAQELAEEYYADMLKVPGDHHVLRVTGRNAEIRITGVMTERPNGGVWVQGYRSTLYPDIRAAAFRCEADPQIDNVCVVINSLGGEAAGLLETVAALASLRKRKTVTVRLVKAYAAAYVLAATAGPIAAVRAALSIGGLDDSDCLDPAVGAAVRAIADGRGVPVADVRENYGAGAEMTAAEALRRGMIDGFAEPSRARVVLRPRTARSPLVAVSISGSYDTGRERERDFGLGDGTGETVSAS